MAVCNLNFVDEVKSELEFKAAHREVIEESPTYVIREQSEATPRRKRRIRIRSKALGYE